MGAKLSLLLSKSFDTIAEELNLYIEEKKNPENYCFLLLWKAAFLWWAYKGRLSWIQCPVSLSGKMLIFAVQRKKIFYSFLTTPSRLQPLGKIGLYCFTGKIMGCYRILHGEKYFPEKRPRFLFFKKKLDITFWRFCCKKIVLQCGHLLPWGSGEIIKISLTLLPRFRWKLRIAQRQKLPDTRRNLGPFSSAPISGCLRSYRLANVHD